jgi:hypothetical protein
MLFLCLHYAYVAYLYELQFFLWEIWLLLIDCPQFSLNKKCYNSAIIMCILLFSLQIVVYILNCNLFFNHLCQWSTNSHIYTYMPILFLCQWSVTFFGVVKSVFYLIVILFICYGWTHSPICPCFSTTYPTIVTNNFQPYLHIYSSQNTYIGTGIPLKTIRNKRVYY